MENTVTNGNIDLEVDSIITKLEQSWLAEKHQFEENKWRETCDELAKQANAGCGLSYDLFVQKLSFSIDFHIQKLNKNHHQKAIEIAKSYGYATPEEIEENQSFLNNTGYCTHGIELGCCPAGCE